MSANPKKIEPWRWTAAALIGVGLGLFLGWFHLWSFVPQITDWWEENWIVVGVALTAVLALGLLIGSGIWRWMEPELKENPIKTAFAVAGVVVITLQIVTSQGDAKAAREAALFSSAVQQLGSGEDDAPPMSVRLGSLAALDKLMARNPEEYHDDVLRLVAAYIRHNSREPCEDKKTREDLLPGETASIEGMAPGEKELLLNRCAELRSDVQRALDVLAYRERRSSEPRVDLRDAHLRRADLRLRGRRRAVLGAYRTAISPSPDPSRAGRGKADRRRANLSGADLRGANLVGARGWFEERLKSAYVDTKTILPNGEKLRCKAFLEGRWPIYDDSNPCVTRSSLRPDSKRSRIRPAPSSRRRVSPSGRAVRRGSGRPG